VAKLPAALESLSPRPSVVPGVTSGDSVAPGSRLRDYVAVLHRYRYLALSAFALTATVIVMQFSSTTQRYEATTRVTIGDEPRPPATGEPDRSRNFSAEQIFQQQLDLLRSRDLARRTLEHIDLRGSARFDDRTSTGGAAADVERFVRAVKVERIGPSRLVNVTVTAADSQFALRAVNALADEFVQQNGRTQNVRVVERAEVSRSIAAEVGVSSWAFALSWALAFALVVPLVTDRLSGKVSAPAHVIGDTRLPFVATVPMMRGDRLPPFASPQTPPPFETAFREISAWLSSNHAAPGAKVLAVTSAGPFEGKTVTASNIALALARAGGRVLLVDADMRQPAVHRLLRIPNERGLSQVLNGQARVRDVIQRTADSNLLAIPAGKTPGSPAELLSSERMKALLTTLSDGAFDWIIIDTPPVLDAIDAVILAPSVTGFVYVARADVTRRRLAARALKTILAAGAGSVAVVLNRVDGSRSLVGRR
jgi:capsular exopolysaccharide synthesis family protein